jgi:CDP-diacylglycerol--serine O-phosphatidyltransferase
MITLTNAVLGFLAILMIFSNQLRLSASFILLGLLADGLDGIVARRVGYGKIGEYLESIADMVSLSIAPLLLLYKTYRETVLSTPWLHLLLGVVLSFSFICSMIRLSSFSLMKKKQFFVGLPTSASAIFLVLISILFTELLVVVPFIFIFSIAMILPLRFPKLGLKINLGAAGFVIATILLYNIYNSIVPLLFLTVLAAYIIIGPFYLSKKKI